MKFLFGGLVIMVLLGGIIEGFEYLSWKKNGLGVFFLFLIEKVF